MSTSPRAINPQARILSLLLSSALCALYPSENWGAQPANPVTNETQLRYAIDFFNSATSGGTANNPNVINLAPGTISLTSSLPAILNNSSSSSTAPIQNGKYWQFNGNNAVIDGGGNYQAFFITPVPNPNTITNGDFDLTKPADTSPLGNATSSTTPLNVTLKDLTIQNCQAKGGNGDGGGMGAGGGVFVNSFADVTLDNVTLNGNNATGGNGKIGVDPNGDGGGGGALNTPHGGQGGDFTGTVGGNGDLGGAGGAYPGGVGGFGGGGGSGNFQGIGHPGGPGGFGGGGGAVATGINLAGGAGGFGGGGGAYGGNGTSVGTLGGFGGGGGVGYTPPAYGGAEPVGGGKAQSYSANGVIATGGGGAGLGGAIFVREKGSITLKNSCSLNSNTVTGGTGSDQSAPLSGAQVGSDLFLMTGVSNLNIYPGVGKTIQFNGTIADDSIHSLPAGGNYVPSNSVGGGIILGDGTNQSTVIFAADNNSYGGTTTITPHTTLQIGNGGATGSLKFDGFYPGTQNIIDNGNLEFNRTIATNFTRAITGTGSLTQAGSGVLTLSVANTYTGGTTINAGATLAISNPGSIASTGAVTADGTLDISQATFSPTIGDLSGASTGVVRLGNFNLTFGTSSSKTFAGAIQDGGIGGGIGGAITKQGTGTEILAGTNTYTGGTTIAAGTLQIGNGGTNGSLGTGNVVDNGTLAFNLSSSSTISQNISGTGSLTQAGTGIITLIGANTYQGGTSIYGGGAIQISSDAKLGASAPLTMGDMTTSGTLKVSAPLSSARIITLNAGGGKVDTNGNAVTLSGNITGVGGFTKLNAGTLTLTGTNGYTGGTTISSGTLQLGDGVSNGTLGSGPITDNGTLAFNQATATTFSQAINGTGGLTQSGPGTVILTGTNGYTGGTTIAAGTLQLGDGVSNGTLGSGPITDNGTLTFNQATATTFSQAINGTGGLTQSGPGKVTLTGANTYAGGTTIAAGTLQIGNGGATGSIGSGAITDNGNLTFDLSSNTTINKIISGIGSLTQAGSGITTFVQANTYSGGTSITGGTLTLSGSGSLAPTGAVTVGGGVNGTFNISGISASSTTIGDFWGTGTANVNLGTKTLVFGAGTNTTYMGTIQGTGGLIKQGAGTFEISGVQNYTGLTNVNAGVFNLSTPNATLTSDVTVATGATFSGTGIVENLTSAGTVSPGYPGVGTITVNGDLNLLTGGTYRADITPSNLPIGLSDTIDVSGAAILDGALTIVPQPGIYNSSTRYTLISATGGVYNTFSTITPVPGYKFKTYYNPNSMQIGINNNLSDVVSTNNPGKLATYLDQIDGTLVPGSDLANIITLLEGLSPVDLRDALDQIQPSLLLDTETTQELAIMGLFEGIFSNLHTHHTQSDFNYLMEGNSFGEQSLSQEFMSLVNNTDSMMSEFSLKAKNKTRHKPQKKGRTKVPPENRKQKPIKRAQKKRNRSQPQGMLLEQLPQNMRTNIGNMNLWIQQSGNYMKQNHNQDNVGFDGNSYMTSVGFDTKINKNLVVGVTGAAGQNNLDWNKDRGDAQITNYQMGVYGSWMPCQTKAYLDFAGFVNRRRTSSKREISFPGYSATAKQKHWGTDYSTGFKGGYFFQLPRKMTLEPFVQVGYTWMHDERFQEKGASGINMMTPARSNQFVTSRVGAELSYMTTYRDWMIRPAVHVGYAMYYRTQGKGSLTANIVDQPSFFVVTGAESKQNMFDGKLALTALHKCGFYVNAVYNADANSSLQYHTGMVQFGWRF